MTLANRSTTPKVSRSPSFDGRGTYVGGFSGLGKTSLALHELPRPFLFFCTDVSNESVKALDYVTDSRSDLEYVKNHPTETFAIRCFTKNPDILQYCKDHRRAYCFDEAANLFFKWQMMESFVEYMREVRYCDGGLNVWITSQRAASDVRPAVFKACRRIKWVGALYGDEDCRALYSNRSYNIVFKDFCAKLNNLKPFNWKNPNVSDAVLTVKDI